MNRRRLTTLVLRSQTTRFPCGCRVVLDHEFDVGLPDCYVYPCGPPDCPVFNSLRDVRVIFCDDYGSTTIRPAFPGGP